MPRAHRRRLERDERQAREEPLRPLGSRALAAQQPLDERVARGRGVHVPAGRQSEVARRCEDVRHRSHRVLAHHDALRERLVGDHERVGVDRVEDHGARVGQHAEHRLDRVGADPQVVDDVARELRRFERRQVERYVGRRRAPGARTRRRPRCARRRTRSPSSSFSAIAAQVSNVSGPSTRLSGTPSAAASACAARPSRPSVSTAACTFSWFVLVRGVPTSCQTHANDKGVSRRLLARPRARCRRSRRDRRSAGSARS